MQVQICVPPLRLPFEFHVLCLVLLVFALGLKQSVPTAGNFPATCYGPLSHLCSETARVEETVCPLPLWLTAADPCLRGVIVQGMP